MPQGTVQETITSQPIKEEEESDDNNFDQAKTLQAGEVDLDKESETSTEQKTTSYADYFMRKTQFNGQDPQ